MKVAIPKMKRPSSSANTPIVLQLGADGLYYATQQPLVVKTEMSTPVSQAATYCSPLVSAATTITTPRDAEEVRAIYLSIYLSIHLSIYPSINLTIFRVTLPPEEDLQTKAQLVRFRQINASGSRINFGQIATPNPKILLKRLLD